MWVFSAKWANFIPCLINVFIIICIWVYTPMQMEMTQFNLEQNTIIRILISNTGGFNICLNDTYIPQSHQYGLPLHKTNWNRIFPWVDRLWRCWSCDNEKILMLEFNKLPTWVPGNWGSSTMTRHSMRLVYPFLLQQPVHGSASVGSRRKMYRKIKKMLTCEDYNFVSISFLQS